MHIVFLHINPCEHLPLALYQAKTSFPQATITLLGNAAAYEHVKQRIRGRMFFDFVDLDELASEQLVTFQGLYQHLSANDYYVERLCLERWFYLKTWMMKKNVADCVYLDSDVLIYPPASPRLFPDEKPSTGCAFVIPDGMDEHCRWAASAHVSRWSRTALDQFCDFVLHSYQDEATMKRYAEMRRRHKAANSRSGISDMTSLYFFQLGRKDVDNLFILKEASVFDDNINIGDATSPYEYKMKHGIKLVTFLGQIPHLTLLANPPVLIPAGALHFQGVGKFHMRDYYQGPKLRFPVVKTFIKNCKVRLKRMIDLVWPGSRHDIKALQKEIRECKTLLRELSQQYSRKD